MDIRNLKTKAEYKEIYGNSIDALVKRFEDEGYDDPGYMATIEFDETATADEVVGYYIYNEGDNALNQWLENTDGIDFSEQDKEVDAILKALYKKV